MVIDLSDFPNFNPTVNVGIKLTQKIELLKLLKEHKIESVNKFVQQAVDEKLKS